MRDNIKPWGREIGWLCCYNRAKFLGWALHEGFSRTRLEKAWENASSYGHLDILKQVYEYDKKVFKCWVTISPRLIRNCFKRQLLAGRLEILKWLYGLPCIGSSGYVGAGKQIFLIAAQGMNHSHIVDWLKTVE